MVDGLQLFNVTEEQALVFVNKFLLLKKDKGDYSAMINLFEESLDDEVSCNLLLLSAWRSLIEISNIIIKEEAL